jgi:uncharacterized membrane protein
LQHDARERLASVLGRAQHQSVSARHADRRRIIGQRLTGITVAVTISVSAVAISVSAVAVTISTIAVAISSVAISISGVTISVAGVTISVAGVTISVATVSVTITGIAVAIAGFGLGLGSGVRLAVVSAGDGECKQRASQDSN